MATQAKTIAFHTLGCKLNFSETSTISRDFIDQGFIKVDYRDVADIYVLNTCSVTENADKEARKLIRQAKRRNPNSFVAVMGCYAQLKPDEISKIDGVDIVVGAENKFDILDYLDKVELQRDCSVYTSDIKKTTDFKPSYSLGERTRSYLKVQDGCDYTCSFCTIPMARGKSRSDKIERIIQMAKEIALSGKKEIVLTGVNIGDYGKGTRESFLDLIKELDKINGIKRIRISSIEPNLLSDEIIDFCNSSKLFMPHFHIPLQSGSNKILRLMRRRYDTELYSSRVNYIKSINQNVCIGADVIVGFPGESDEDFLDTYNFIKNTDISYLHVFTYSERTGTDALGFSNSVSKQKRNERSKILRELSDEKKKSFYEQHVSTNRDVLFETINNGMLSGYTDNYIQVKVESHPNFMNTIYPISLVSIDGSDVRGKILG